MLLFKYRSKCLIALVYRLADSTKTRNRTTCM